MVSPPLAAGLYLVATPIGNLEDMTFRAVRVLKSADMIACEDTRTSRTLLDHYGIHKPLVPYHEHSREDDRERLAALVREGKSVALISDAGTPLISDPGFKLARSLRAEGLPVTAIPGPCAAIAALTLSALPTDRFLFAGFVPNKDAARRAWLEEMAEVDATLVCYESTHRIGDTVQALAALWPARRVALVREITKRYEEVIAGDAPTVAAEVARRGVVKGEIVLVVGPPSKESSALPEHLLEQELRALLAEHSVKEAAKLLAEKYRLPKREIYNKALGLKGS